MNILDDFPYSHRLCAAYGNPIAEFGNKELVFEGLLLDFSACQLLISVVSETDELEIECPNDIAVNDRTDWTDLRLSMLGEPLIAAWFPENNRGYRDTVLFGFTFLRPTFGIVVEAGALKLFSCELLS